MKENVNEIATKLKENTTTVINEIATKEKIPDLILYTMIIGLIYILISYSCAISPLPAYLLVIPIYMLYKRYHAINWGGKMVKVRKLNEEEKENDRTVLRIESVVIGKYAYGYTVYDMVISEKTGEETVRNKRYPANFEEALKMVHERLLRKKLDERPVEDLKSVEKLISLIENHDKWFEEIAQNIIENGGLNVE